MSQKKKVNVLKGAEELGENSCGSFQIILRAPLKKNLVFPLELFLDFKDS